ncbi:MAG: hypothetical protein AAF693_19255 [Bacteroidota bacterium]
MYKASHIFQADPEWSITVHVEDFSTEKEANAKTNVMGVKLMYVNRELFYLIDHEVFKKMEDQDVIIEKLKPESMSKGFVDQEDYEKQDISIFEMWEHKGLMSGFESLAYNIEKCN